MAIKIDVDVIISDFKTKCHGSSAEALMLAAPSPGQLKPPETVPKGPRSQLDPEPKEPQILSRPEPLERRRRWRTR